MFFRDLFNLSENLEVTMTIKRKNDRLTISFLPVATADICPVILTGTPEELDTEFIQKISIPVSACEGLQVDSSFFANSLENAGKVEGASSVAVTSRQSKKTKNSNQSDGKPEVSQPTRDPKNTSPIEPTLFDLPS